MNLPERLERIVKLCPETESACDIGCDHAYVAIELVKRGKAGKLLACDIHEGPLRQAEKNIRAEGLERKIEIRLGDGLTPVERGEAETVICAGMGGALIVHILRDRLPDFRYFLLSPQSEPELLRKYLFSQGIRILEEEMLKDGGKYYVLILAENPNYSGEMEIRDKTEEVPEGRGAVEEVAKKETEEELLYGSLLLKKKDEILREYLLKEKARYEGILLKTDRTEIREAYQHCLTALGYY